VTDKCGANDVDIAAALKMYDDYCAVNGFPIPGYTYISTQTVHLSIATSTVAAETASATLELSTGGSGPAITPVTITTSIVTGVSGGVVTATATATATTTVLRSSGSKLQAWPSFFHLLYLLHYLPTSILILGLPQSLVVTYTAPAPSEVVFSVLTTYVAPVPAATTITSIDYETPLQSTSMVAGISTTNGVQNGKSTSSVSVSAGGDFTSSQSNNKNPTRLETIGIVIGIVMGIITTVATVWMCARANASSSPAAE
jgi:hypothetical protein